MAHFWSFGFCSLAVALALAPVPNSHDGNPLGLSNCLDDARVISQMCADVAGCAAEAHFECPGETMLQLVAR